MVGDVGVVKSHIKISLMVTEITTNIEAVVVANRVQARLDLITVCDVVILWG